MADPGPLPEHRGMDEDTIDCQYCGAGADVEVRVQYLDDTANWKTIRKIIACRAHAARLEFTVCDLLQGERLVVMRCS